jgi:hypothetical protein
VGRVSPAIDDSADIDAGVEPSRSKKRTALIKVTVQGATLRGLPTPIGYRFELMGCGFHQSIRARATLGR